MAFGFVQSAEVHSSSGISNILITPPSGILTSDTALGVVHYSTSAGSAIGLNSFQDQSGNPLGFLEVGTGIFNAATEFGLRLVYLSNAPPSITGVEAIMNSTCNLGMSFTLLEYSGLALSAALVGFNSSNATATLATDNITSGVFTPGGQPAMVFGVSSDDSRSNHIPAAGTGFTGRQSFFHSATSAPGGFTEDLRITSFTPVAATFTNTGTSGDKCPCIMAMFAESGAPASPTFSANRIYILP